MNIWIRALITFIIIQLIIFSVFYIFTKVFPMPFEFVLMAYIPLAIVTALAIVLVVRRVNRNTPRK
jgi:hypothetical protein